MQFTDDVSRPGPKVKPECDVERGAEGLVLHDINLLDSLADSFVDSLDGNGSDCMLQMLLDNFGSPDGVLHRPGAPAAGPPPAPPPYNGPDGHFSLSPVSPFRNQAPLAPTQPPAPSYTAPAEVVQPAAAPPPSCNGAAPASQLGAFIPTPAATAAASQPPPAAPNAMPRTAFADRPAQQSLLGLGTGGAALSPGLRHAPGGTAVLPLESSSPWSPALQTALRAAPEDLRDHGEGLMIPGGLSGSSWYPDHSPTDGAGGPPHLSSGLAAAPSPISAQLPAAMRAASAAATPSPGPSQRPAPPPAAPPVWSSRGDRRRSLLLRVFHGLMRPEVAPLAVAAAQRACVTEPSVRPGLYFTVAQQVAVTVPQPGFGGSGGAAGGGGGGGGGSSWVGGGGVGGGGQGRGPAKPPKRGGVKDRLGGGGAAATTTVPRADPFGRLYPEANEELMAALYGTRPLPKRVRVDPIRDRCHPCFRNPFEGLASVPERRKLVSCGSIPDGFLLGPYTGEIRSGRMDERLVGGDLSGVEGLKAAYTLTLVDDLEAPQPPAAAQKAQPAPSAASSSQPKRPPGQGPGIASAPTSAGGSGPIGLPGAPDSNPGPDCLVVVGDPGTCALAEANTPRFWGPCSSLAPGSVGLGNLAACNCRAYKGREANAAVVPCVLKVSVARLRAAVEAELGGEQQGGDEQQAEADARELRAGLEALRAAAAAVTPPGDNEATTYVYGIVVAVVTSRALEDGCEVLLRWDSDDSFFAVAEQNLRQYQHIHKLISERDAAEARYGDQRRELALLRRAHKECRVAREAAVRQQQDAERQRDDAARQLDETRRQLDDAVKQRDDAVQESLRLRAVAAAQAESAAAAAMAEAAAARAEAEAAAAAAAATAAAKGARVAALEGMLGEAVSERDALRVEVSRLRQQLLEQPTCADGGFREPAAQLSSVHETHQHSSQQQQQRQQPQCQAVDGQGPVQRVGEGALPSAAGAVRQGQAASPASAEAQELEADDGDAPWVKRRRLEAGAVGFSPAGPLPIGPGNGDITALSSGTAAAGLINGTAAPTAAAARLMQRYAAARRLQDEAVSELLGLLGPRDTMSQGGSGPVAMLPSLAPPEDLLLPGRQALEGEPWKPAVAAAGAAEGSAAPSCSLPRRSQPPGQSRQGGGGSDGLMAPAPAAPSAGYGDRTTSGVPDSVAFIYAPSAAQGGGCRDAAAGTGQGHAGLAHSADTMARVCGAGCGGGGGGGDATNGQRSHHHHHHHYTEGQHHHKYHCPMDHPLGPGPLGEPAGSPACPEGLLQGRSSPQGPSEVPALSVRCVAPACGVAAGAQGGAAGGGPPAAVMAAAAIHTAPQAVAGSM